MKIKISELNGIALDWAVAKCEGIAIRWSAPHETLLIVGQPYVPFVAHRDWGLCGPIIERECIELLCEAPGHMWAAMPPKGPEWRGSTPLIAAMRCYVAHKLGHEVEIPDDLATARTAIEKATGEKHEA